MYVYLERYLLLLTAGYSSDFKEETEKRKLISMIGSLAYLLASYKSNRSH